LPLLPFPASFTKHDCASREFRIRVFDPQLDEFVVEVIPSWRVRFRCSHCHAVFTEYPPFALPHKRFVQQEPLAKVRSPERRQTLEQAAMTLHAADVFYQCFGVSLFTHIATAGVLA
jgi:hypothetical protein